MIWMRKISLLQAIEISLPINHYCQNYWPGVAKGGDGIAQFAVNTATVVKFLVSMMWGSLVLNATDPTDSNNKDDEHEQEGHT